MIECWLLSGLFHGNMISNIESPSLFVRPNEVLDSFDGADAKQFGLDGNHGSFKAHSRPLHRQNFSAGSRKMNASENVNMAGMRAIGQRRP